LTEADVEAIINAGKIEFAQLDQLIPIGTPNTFVPAVRIKHGFKYDWDQADGKQWHVHGHAPDPGAPEGSNASNGWVIRIKCGNRWLLEAPSNPPVGQPSHWTRNKNLAGQAHVPATSETLRTGRRNSFS
jgi:hypothetical protein